MKPRKMEARLERRIADYNEMVSTGSEARRRGKHKPGSGKKPAAGGRQPAGSGSRKR